MLVVGIILGGAGGYFLFKGDKSVTISTQPQASPSPSASATPAPTATATPEPPVTAGGGARPGVVPCPVRNPDGSAPARQPGRTGQRPVLVLRRSTSAAAATPPSPPAPSRFLTGNNWGLGIADSCPVGSSGQSGMNTVLTVTEVTPGGGQGPDTATEPGDWVDSGSVLMATGGSYQLRVTTVSPSCVWHIKIYPTSG